MMNKFGAILREYLEFENISVKDFAYRIGTTPKNLIDILNGKVKLSQNIIYNISFVTDIPVSYIENVEKNFKYDKLIDEYINEEKITIREYIKRFNYNELSKKYGVVYTDIRDDYSIAKDILKYLRITNPKLLYKKNNNILYKSKNERIELLSLWLERCYRVSKNQKVYYYDRSNINKLVTFIREEAKNNLFDEERLIEMFNKNGIYLAIEDDLSGTKVRGAFRVCRNHPAIYITRKYKRIADVYFALLHELAHCSSDFNRAKSGSMVSYFDKDSIQDYEVKADKQAFNYMVDDKVYNKLKLANNIENYDVVKAFLVYRLAHDNIISYSSKLYQDNNPLMT